MESAIFHKTGKGYSHYLDINNEVVGILHPDHIKYIQDNNAIDHTSIQDAVA